MSNSGQVGRRSSGSKRTLGWLSLGAVGLTLVGFWFYVLDATDGSSSTDQDAFGHLSAVIILGLFTVLVAVVSKGHLRGFVLGKDNRASTSKVQVVVWTYAIAAGLLSLIAATWVGPDTGFDKITSSDFDFAPYLILLGGPFAAAVLSRVIVGSQVASGDAAKPPAGEPSAKQVFTDDAGKADIVDCQYLLFNFIALAYYLGAFIGSPSEGLPDIPTILFALTSASAAGYVSNKAIASGTPTVSNIFPQKGPVGTVVEVFGSALLIPDDSQTGSDPVYQDVRVMLAQVEAPIVAGSETHSPGGDDRLRVTVPTLEAGLHDMVLINFRGTQTTAKQFEVT